MNSKDFFNLAQESLDAGKAMVSFRLPGKEAVQLLLQTSKDSFRIKDFSENGFVFSPFNTENNPLFIPENESIKTVLPFFDSSKFQLNSSEGLSENLDSKAKLAHISLVKLGIETINKTTLQKVVLSRKELQKPTISASEIFRNLLSLYPNAFVYIWFHPETGVWIGATPETLLKTERTKFSTMALAGTRKLQDFSENDWTNKEIVEQKIVTDSIISKLKELGYSSESLKVSETYTSEAGSLLHLRTDISGTINNGSAEIGAIIKALHPTPAICGLPTDKAYSFIIEHEKYDREFYSGYLGPLNMTTEIKRSSRTRNQENQAYSSIRKDSYIFVNLRCLKYKKGEVAIYVGGGITKDSEASAEWEETVNKTRTMKAAL
ncbi:isochorismate synthase [Gillisia mitskevichiae]|uniref:Isochorismate synthase n=1 Tax=Gillisia mitskevichiae TaxID=270921 RepID=A0A495PLS7_9FLAO|nr:chorismate-binding protein [Gillisia mitskevichiae]RKS50655.1 isochorismate synthase [Gillisia mitskevichiae]